MVDPKLRALHEAYVSIRAGLTLCFWLAVEPLTNLVNGAD